MRVMSHTLTYSPRHVVLLSFHALRALLCKCQARLATRTYNRQLRSARDNSLIHMFHCRLHDNLINIRGRRLSSPSRAELTVNTNLPLLAKTALVTFSECPKPVASTSPECKLTRLTVLSPLVVVSAKRPLSSIRN